MIRQIYYRGSLNFCNYSCPYCPFAKKKYSERQVCRDRQEWFRFVEYITNSGFDGAVQVVPYGEALIHDYYWQGLAQLSRCGRIRAVGAQSNFSFSVERMTAMFTEYEGDREKLRLWGTFHPGMVSLDSFLTVCEQLRESGIRFCVGGVGVPENLGVLRELRRRLDDGIYMWINKMDGLGRRYGGEEIRAFCSLDPYFPLELQYFRTDASACSESVMIRGDGSIHPCGICRQKMGSLYVEGLERTAGKVCTRRICDCFLAYGGRRDIPELTDFLPFPAFRIPSLWHGRKKL